MNYESKLGDGSRVLFRPITPEDKQRLAVGLKRLSDESRYRRFFTYIDHFTENQLRYLTEVDFEDHYAWIAVLTDLDGEPGVGVGRWIRTEDPGLAEAAVTVIDQYQGRGVGKTMLWLLARSAIEKGIKAFRVWTLGENRPMLDMLERLGAIPGGWESGILELRVPLPADLEDLEATPAPLILRAVASGELRARAHGQLGTRFEHPDE